MAKKRIIELATETTLKDGQYVAIDHTTDGTKKLNLGAELTNLKEDFEALETQLDETTALALAALPQETIENVAIASFDDGGDGVPVKELKIAIEPIQSGSGDPSPTNVRPISGRGSVTVTRTGVNVWDEELEVGGFNVNTGEKSTDNSRMRSKNLIPVLSGQQYYFKIPYAVDSYGFYMFRYDANKNYLGYAVNYNNLQTIPDDTRYINFVTQTTYGTTYNHDISINYPSTDHDYHVYGGGSYPIPLSSTIYGGTLDVGTGTLTVDRALVTFDGSETWVLYVDSPNNLNQLYTSVQTKYVADKVLCVCDKYKSISIANRFGNYNTCYIGTNSICFNVEGYDVASWKTYLASNNVTVAYYIPTPTTVQLTPTQVTTLLKDNNIFADSGDVKKLIYRADLGAYIEKLINA